jgi:hypothetical protein
MHRLFLLLLSFISMGTVFAADYSPFNRDAYLTSSFAENRGSRYHAGIDYSTEMEEGWPILAPEDGEIQDIKVSPFGYGKVLYFKGKSGMLWVFAHLSEFNESIQQLVDRRQSSERRNDVSIILPDLDRVKKGDTLAFSGSTGIGAPHLHIETRITKDKIISPCQYGVQCLDTIAPFILGAAAWRNTQVVLTDEQSLQNGCLAVPNEDTPLRLAFKIVDYSRYPLENPMSIRRIELKVEKRSLYKRIKDTLSFNSMLKIRDELLWAEEVDTAGDWHLMLGALPTERTIRLEVEDYSGNVSFRDFTLQPSCSTETKVKYFKQQDSILFTFLSRAYLNLGECSKAQFELKDSQNKTLAYDLCTLYPQTETPVAHFFEKFPTGSKILVKPNTGRNNREIFLYPLNKELQSKIEFQEPFFFSSKIKGLKNRYIKQVIAIQETKKDSVSSIEFHPKGLQFFQGWHLCFDSTYIKNPIFWLGETSREWFVFSKQTKEKNKRCIKTNELRDIASIQDSIPPAPGVPYFKNEKLRIPVIEQYAGIRNGNSFKVNSLEEPWITAEYDSDPKELVIKKELLPPAGDSISVFMQDVLGNAKTYSIIIPE